MINAQLNLVIPVFLAESNSFKILSLQDYNIVFPSAEINSIDNADYSLDIDAIIVMLLNRYFDSSISIVPKLTDVQIINNVLMIYYICFINYEAKIINGVLKDIDVNNNVFPTNTAKIISLLVKK